MGDFVISFSVVKAKMIRRPPDTTKAMSARMYVRKILSRAILIDEGSDVEKMSDVYSE